MHNTYKCAGITTALVGSVLLILLDPLGWQKSTSDSGTPKNLVLVSSFSISPSSLHNGSFSPSLPTSLLSSSAPNLTSASETPLTLTLSAQVSQKFSPPKAAERRQLHQYTSAERIYHTDVRRASPSFASPSNAQKQKQLTEDEDVLRDKKYDKGKYPFSPVQPKRYWPEHDLITDGLYPRMIGIGCQKCGTSSLAAYLSFIEGFKMSSNKEVHAFRGDKTHRLLEKDPYGVGRIWMSKSLRWYQHKWNKHGLQIRCHDKPFLRCKGNAAQNDVPFEITPRYMSDYRVPFNMWESLPSPRQMKFIVVLRNPTARTWSAFSQNMHQRDWDPKLFIQQTREEIKLLYACYNSTIGLLSQLTNKKQLGMQSLHLCRDPRLVYQDLQSCMIKYNPNISHPWFMHYSQIEMDQLPEYPLNKRIQYEGITMRGIYADQLFNFLCAGFFPEQFLIMTAGDVEFQDDWFHTNMY